MIGTLINSALVIIGGILGLLIGKRLSPKFQQTIMAGLGLFTLGYGIILFIKTSNPLIPLGGMIIGVILGEWWRLEDHLTVLGEKIKNLVQKYQPESSNSLFVDGFVTASLLFCIGPMAIMGSIQDGLTGDSSTLIVKSIMDGFAAMVFSSTLGVGVIFSALSVLLYQGTISLFAGILSNAFSDAMINELSAVGGLILLGLAISSLLEVKKIRVGSFLPAMLVTPLIVWILSLLRITF